MLTNTVVSLINHHTLGKLVSIQTKNGNVYLASSHSITMLAALESFAVVKTPTPSNDLIYIDFDHVSQLRFQPGEAVISDTAGDIEGKLVNESKVVTYVTQADINSEPSNYIQESLGQIKTTRAFANNAVVGDPCLEVQIVYKSINPLLQPTAFIKNGSTVTADDLAQADTTP